MANQDPTIPTQPDIEGVIKKSLKMHFDTYEEYADYAKDVNEEVLTLIDWTRETQERSIENQGSFYTKLLKNSINLTEEVKKKFTKDIVGSLKSIASGITSTQKEKVPRSPTLSSISGRNQSGFGGLLTGIRTAFQKEDVKFLLKNDPDFQGASIKEVKAILKQREKSTKELAALEAKQEKLVGLGGFDKKTQEKIDEIKSFLDSGKKKAADYEREKTSYGQVEPTSGQTKRGRATNQSYIEAASSSWMTTLDKGNIAIVTNLIKLDNRLASIEGLVTKIVRTDRTESQRLDEAREETPKLEASGGKQTTDNLKQAEEIKEKTEESKGIIGQIAGLMGNGDTGILGTLLGIKKVFSFFPILAPALIGITTILISKKFVDAIGEMSLFGESGEKTKAGEFIEGANKLAGGQGLKPESEKSRVEKIKSDADTGWWDFGDKKKERYKQQYLGELERGGEFTKEEASALKENFGIDVPESNIKVSEVQGRVEELNNNGTKKYSPDSQTVAHGERNSAREELDKFRSESGKMELISSGEYGDEFGYADPEKQKKYLELRKNLQDKQENIRTIASESKPDKTNIDAASSYLQNNGFMQPNPLLKFGKVASDVNLKMEEAKAPTVKAPDLYPMPRNFGEKLGVEQKQLEMAEQKAVAMGQAAPAANVVIAPSSSNTINNTTAVGIRTTPRHAEKTFERAVGNRYSFDW